MKFSKHFLQSTEEKSMVASERRDIRGAAQLLSPRRPTRATAQGKRFSSTDRKVGGISFTSAIVMIGIVTQLPLYGCVAIETVINSALQIGNAP